MGVKKSGERFSIVFSRTDPLHLQVAEILNRQDYRGKAQYIVNAVLHYESCDEKPDTKWARIDEKMVEAVLNRLLKDRSDAVIQKTAVAAAADSDKQPSKPSQLADVVDEELIYDEAMDALGEVGFNAIADVLDMFRKK